MTVLIQHDRATQTVDAEHDDGRMWLSPDELTSATGWELKPEGLCKADACVPVPPDGRWVDDQGRVDLLALADHLGMPVVRDGEHDVVAIGQSAGARREQLQSLEAPDFTLRDVEGQEHSLSDYRGKKVFLYSWASYCGCSFDLPVWQVVYDELREEGLEIVAVALDTAGSEAAAEKIKAEDASERPEVLRRIRAWGEKEWAAQSPPEYPCLIDPDHEVAELYGMTNVPMAVWIDEEGRIVRPTEPAGVGDEWRAQDPVTFEIPDENAESGLAKRTVYLDALRDWVRNGADSEYALGEDEVRQRLRMPDDDDVRAATHIRVANHLFEQGDVDAAERHVREAVRLCPDRWNYRRQSMVLDEEWVGQINVSDEFWQAMEDLGDDLFYEPLKMQGISD